MSGFTLCSKSRWLPAIRREHAFSQQAAGHGLDVEFIEAPSDVRALRSLGAGRFLRGLGGTGGRHGDDGPVGGLAGGGSIRVVERTVPVPGHRGPVAEASEARLLRGILAGGEGPVVCMLPWQWPATAGGVRRRVFDCADDWTRLYPASRTPRFTELFARIAAEADQVTVTSPDLARLFPGRQVVVVPNGADAAAIADRPVPPPGRCALAYVGTLSERFDLDLVTGVLDRLPGWTLDLFGPCHYAASGDRPTPEVEALLTRSGGRVRWHGTIPRTGVADAIDRADVLVVPSRSALSEGQSSMKLFDMAARGRPAVVSPGVTCDGTTRPPGTLVADGTDAWVAAIEAAGSEPSGLGEQRIAWARANTWEHRWPAWAGAVTGELPLTGAAGAAGAAGAVA